MNNQNEDKNETYAEFSQRFEAEQEVKSRLRLEELNNETPLLPLKIEIIGYINEFIRILDLSIEWFLLSRNTQDSEKKGLYSVIHSFYSVKADVIVGELEGVVYAEL